LGNFAAAGNRRFSISVGRRGDLSPFHSGSNSAFSPKKIPAYPSRCPTPCVLLAGVNTFIDLLFITLTATAAVSAFLLLAELWGTTRR